MAGEQEAAPSIGPLPWEPDRPLTIDDAAAAIRASFPTIESEGLKHLGSGWEFDAFVTSDGWVFRSRAVPVARTSSTPSDEFTTSSPRSCRRQLPFLTSS